MSVTPLLGSDPGVPRPLPSPLPQSGEGTIATESPKACLPVLPDVTDQSMEMFLQWYRAVKRHPIVTTGAALSVVAITMGVILFYPRGYRSSTELLLRVGYENASVDPTTEAAGQMVQMQLTREHDIQTALQVMHSRALLAEVVDRVGTDRILDGDGAMQPGRAAARPGWIDRLVTKLGGMIASIDPMSQRERAIRELAGRLDVFAADKTSVVTAQYKADSPQFAQQVLDTWLNAYLSKHAELHRTSGSHAFFRAEETQLRESLDRVYEELRAAKTDSGLVTIAGQQKLLEDQLAAVRAAMIEANTALAGSQARTEALTKALEQTEIRMVIDETIGKANEARDAMRSQLFELEVLERELAAKYRSDHPRLITVRNQLEEARRIVDEQRVDRAEVTSGINPVHQALQQEWLLETAVRLEQQQRLESLVRQRDDLRDEIALLNDAEQSIVALERRAEILETQYTQLSERLDQSRIDESLREQKISSVNVIQPPSLEERPVTPNKRLTAAFGLFALLGSVIGLPLVLESLRSPAAFATAGYVVMPRETSSRQFGPSEQQELLHPMFHDDATPDDQPAAHATDQL